MIHLIFLSLFVSVLGDGIQQQPGFREQLIDENVAIGYGLAIGDVDGDGKQDILLADKKQIVWYRNGDWRRFVVAEDLTEFDNVCIAARDLDGDGKVEIAVGAQWNPSETSDTVRSGAVFYLVRPTDPTQKWRPVRLHHEPVTHRMRWVKAGDSFHLVVLPLHGRGNKDGEGRGVRVFAYEFPRDPANDSWKLTLMDESMHLTHNLDVVARGGQEFVYIGGKEGVKRFHFNGNRWSRGKWVIQSRSFGEVRAQEASPVIAGIEPMHGNELTVYTSRHEGAMLRTVLTKDMNQGHALAVADLLGLGQNQIVAGWRNPDSNGKVGIKLFVQGDSGWDESWVDENGMACEDLVVADLNGDGKLDIIAAGRATRNLKVYWG